MKHKHYCQNECREPTLIVSQAFNLDRCSTGFDQTLTFTGNAAAGIYAMKIPWKRC